MSSSATSSSATTRAVNPIAQYALYAGIVGLAIGIAGIFMGTHGDDPARPLLGYLIGFGFWFSMAIGMTMLVVLFYVFDAGWPIVLRRQLEHALAAVPWLALCFLPLLLVGLGVLGHDK